MSCSYVASLLLHTRLILPGWFGRHRASGNCILTKILIVRRWRPGKTHPRAEGKRNKAGPNDLP